MTPGELEKIGRLLFGPQWQTKLAKKIGVTDRTVRNWKSGKCEISQVTVTVIKGLIIRQPRSRK